MTISASMTATSTAIPKFDFVNAIHEGFPVAAERYDACVEFYTRVLGLTQIPRPKALDELGKGAWFTNDEKTIQFHLIVNDSMLRPGPEANIEPAGRHTAWRITDPDAFRARMDALGQHFDELGGLINQAQLFVKDPEGHTWEFQGPVPKT